MFFVDTHAHLNFETYRGIRDKIIKESLKDNIWIINVGSQYSSSQKAVEISQHYKKGVYAAIGLHPLYLKTNLVKAKKNLRKDEDTTVREEFNYQRYKKLVFQNSEIKKKIIAIGEIGLDYYYKPKSKQKFEIFKKEQLETLGQQVFLAQELDLPIIFHCRFAHSDLFEFLKNKINTSKLRGVIHCFTSDWNQAKNYLNLGFYLSFNALIFKLNLNEVIKKIPLERTLVETDCPFLLPPGYFREQNDPLSLRYIIQKIAEIRKMDFVRVAEFTTQNAQDLFGLDTS